MASSPTTTPFVLLTVLSLILLARPASAFGAGNIASLSSIEGQNWRHGDIEDVLLTLLMARVAGGKKFSKMDVKRVYFGNWLRDYSQAVDVGTVKYVSAEAIRILLWVLGFMSFGYGTGEFEVTTERLGCYQPTEHIDNPLGYAAGDDARNYDRRLRGPVDEQRELSIDPRTGLKNYIASEDAGIATSAGLVRNVLGKCIELGRRYGQSGKKADLHEALRLLGTGLHCLEDYAAHSNYTELSLIELGERDIFPHVGRNTQIQLQGARNPVYPIVTGTFGGVDFLHSVMGEFSDKATQSELQSLEGAISDSQNQGNSKSFLQELLGKIPSGMFGGGDDNSQKMDEFQANAQNQSAHANVSPKRPEEWTKYLSNVQRQIYPVLEWHDNILQAVNEALEKIPGIVELVEQIQDEINIFVFSILAPYVLPIIQQVKSELETGSSEVIQSSKEQQHNIFNNDNSTDPTHSMLSKDHFSNVLNEPAGKVAKEVVAWTVPQIMECWDNQNVDVNRTLNRIIYGTFHHPAYRQSGEDGMSDIRQRMFGAVENWWQEQGNNGRRSLSQQLSREGVKEGRNHKPGVVDHGHGCGKPLALPQKGQKKNKKSKESGGVDDLGKMAEQAVGGGALGSMLGGIVSSAGSGFLSGDSGFGGGESTEQKYKEEKKYKKHDGYGDEEDDWKKKEKKEKKHKEKYGGGYDEEEEEEKEYKKDKKHKEHKHEKKHSKDGSHPGSYGRSEYQQTSTYDNQGGYRQAEYSRTDYGGQTSERYQETSKPAYGGHSSGYKEERTYGSSGGYGGGSGYHEERTYESSSGRTGGHQETRTYGDTSSSGYGRNESGYSAGGSGGGYQQQTSTYGSDNTSSYGRNQGDSYSGSGEGYQQQSSGYGGGNTSSYGRTQGDSYSGGGGYQQTQSSGYGGASNTYGDNNTSSYGRSQGDSYSGGGGYQQQTSRYGDDNTSSYSCTQGDNYSGGGGYQQTQGSGYGDSSNTYGSQSQSHRQRSRSRSRSKDRKSRQYESSAYGSGHHDRRHGSEERDSYGGRYGGGGDSYQEKHHKKRDDDSDGSDDGYKKHGHSSHKHHGHHHSRRDS